MLIAATLFLLGLTMILLQGYEMLVTFYTVVVPGVFSIKAMHSNKLED